MSQNTPAALRDRLDRTADMQQGYILAAYLYDEQRWTLTDIAEMVCTTPTNARRWIIYGRLLNEYATFARQMNKLLLTKTAN